MTDSKGFSDNQPSPETEARAFVGRIQHHIEAKRAETPEEEAAKLRRLQNRILESLDDAAHVIPELLQNADDAGDGCTAATIRLRDDELVVENDGEGMSEAEVKALGEFAESTKRDLSQIGHFGIGFKTVFSVTDRPHVDTGYVSLEYSEDEPEIPQSAFDGVESEFEGTRVRLPFSDGLSDTRLDSIHSQLDTIDRLLPFLNNLQTITVERDGDTTTYERVDTSNDSHVTVREYENKDDDSPRDTWHYRLCTKALDIDSETVEDLAKERDLDLEALENRDVDIEVELSFPVSEQGHPTGHDDSRLFCYFPTGEETKLPFDVQADFLLKSSREQIRPGHPINDTFLEIAGSLPENAIQTFQAEDVPPSSLLNLIPDPDPEGSRPDYLSPLTDEAFDVVSELEFVPVESGGTRAPEDLLILPSCLRDVIPLAEFCAEYEDADVGHPDQKLSAGDFQRLEALESTRDPSVPETVEEMADMDFLSKFKYSEVVDLLAAVGGYLDSIRSHRSEYDQTIEGLQSLPVYPIRGNNQDRQSLDTIDDAIYRPVRQGSDVYQPFYDDLTLLGDALLSALRSEDDQTKANLRNLFSNRLEVEEIQHETIVKKVVSEAFAAPEERNNETLDEYIEYLCDHAQSHIKHANTKLRTKAGDYKPPNELYLPDQYLENRYDSSLVLGTLTDRDPVSTSYLDRNPETEDTEAWREFFAALGVLTHLRVSPDVDRPTKETFQSGDEICAFLDEHHDEGTTVRPDRDTIPYNGYQDQYEWLKSADAQHGLVDYAIPEDVEDRFEDAAETTDGFGWEFIKMLDSYWDSTDTESVVHDDDWDGEYQNSMFRDYCWSVDPSGDDVKSEKSECPTSFLQLLRNTAWLPGPDEEHYQPTHLYIPNAATEQAEVPLLPEKVADLSPDLLGVLNIPDSVGLEQHANGIEQVVAERGEDDASDINGDVRSHLHLLVNKVSDASEDEIAELREQLADCPFIYIEHAEPEFRTLDQVVWSSGLGDFVVAIDDHYRVFEDFFLDVLDVAPEPSLDDYIEYLGQADAEDWSTVADAWKEVIKRVAYDDQPDHNLDEVAKTITEKGAVPSAAETLVSNDEIQYIARDVGAADRLPEALAEQVALPWYNERKTDHSTAVDRLMTLLDAAKLENDYDREVTAPSQKEIESTFSGQYRTLLNVGVSLLADRDEDDAKKTFEKIGDFTVQTAETVRCRYRLGSDSTKVDEPVYVAQDQEHVYVSEDEAVELDLVEDIAATLELTRPTRNQFVDLVQGAVGKEWGVVDAYLDSRDIPYQCIEPERQEEDRDSESADETDIPGADEEGSVPPNTERGTIVGYGSKGSDDTADEARGAPVPNPGDARVREFTPGPTNDPKSEGSESTGTGEFSDDWGGSSEVDLDSDTDTGSGGKPFGEPGEGKETGDAGEQFVLDRLRDLLSAEIDDAEVTSPPETGSKAYRVEGHSDGREVVVTLRKVPDHERPRSDLLIEGASLKWQDKEFAVDEVASDAQTLVEVKSSKEEANAFLITGPEHNEAQGNPDYLIARPVDVGSEDEHIETVFDTVPKMRILTKPDGRLEINNLELEYKGVWVSY